MTFDLTFLPYPRKITVQDGEFHIQNNQNIAYKTEASPSLVRAANKLSEDVGIYTKRTWHAVSGPTSPDDDIAVQISINPEITGYAQGYQLEISPKRIQLAGSDEPGVFYSIQTLRQIVSQSQRGSLPCMTILDWPDFPVRGVMLDISRDKVYRMETLLMLINELASWKINQVQLYTEHTFAYQGHETVWQESSPMTPEEIHRLDAYCRERFIELVPNQNSLGHMTRWLKHPQYQHLAETLDPVMTPWGTLQTEPFSLSPVLPESLAFISSLYDQLLPNFSSRMVNVGCDETFDIGAGKSKTACEEIGTGQVYLDYLLSLHRDLSSRDHRMQFWGDIILQHTELIPQLPKDAIALDWGYEADHPFAEETRRFQAADIPYYVCPGTSSWNSLGGRIDNMLENCRMAAEQGLKNGAAGYLNTDWGDNGHWQQLPISYPGFAAGAAFSWCLQENDPIDLEKVLNAIVFKDHANILGGILEGIGNEYQTWDLLVPNCSPIFWLLQLTTDRLQQFAIDDPSPIQNTLERLEAALDDLEKVHSQRSDAEQIKNEVRLTIQLMEHACKRGLMLYAGKAFDQSEQLLREINELIIDYERLWMNRNRVGGLEDSLKRFTPLLKEYQIDHG